MMGTQRLRVMIFITRGEPGGAQVHVLSLVAGLRAHVDVAVGVGDDDDYLACELRAAGVAVYVLPDLQRSIDPRQDRRALRAMRTAIRGVQPHIVHTHSTKAGLLGRLAAKLEGLPAIHTAHAWSFSDGLAWRRKALAIPTEALAGRITRRFIVVSAADREIALRYRVARPEQVRIIHNGVTDVPDRADPAGGAPPIIAMVARMAPPKDHDLLLQALAGVTAPFQVWLIGDGPGRAEVEAQLERLGLSDRTSLLGVRRDVPALLAQVQLFVLCSRQEGFPLATLEAMRAGLPVIASDVGGVREAVSHGQTGLLVGRGDEQSLRDGLQRLLSDPELRAAFGAAGRAAFDEHFSVALMVDRTLAVYAEVAREDGLPLPTLDVP
ncbi:MAG: glycosyltransferase involved in cell wall biosynthesis [Myxococcota bacterium]|jgi:glycosyltransferase involved in cell wall biosynthesis